MIKPFANTSLVEIACKKILKSKVIPKDNFYLSVYDDVLVDIGKKHGVNIYHRSEASAKSEGPMQEVMEWHDKLPYKYAIVINACCPLLKVETIDKFVDSYLKSPYTGMFGVIEKRNYFWDENHDMITHWPVESDVLNTKLVGITYEAAHCLYAGRMEEIAKGIWMSKPPFVKNSPALFVVPEVEVFDIDYPWQFNVAESLYRELS